LTDRDRRRESARGKSLDELAALVRGSGLTKHGEIQSDGQSAATASGLSADDVVAGLYTGAKAALRPIHDKLMAETDQFGEFETAPKRPMSACAAKSSSP
jgi:hypothetical protein